MSLRKITRIPLNAQTLKLRSVNCPPCPFSRPIRTAGEIKWLGWNGELNKLPPEAPKEISRFCTVG